MRSPRRALIERVHALSDDSRRFVDCAVRVRVYRRGANGEPEHAEWWPTAHGGVYDRFTARYTGARPQRIVELKIHTGQRRLIEAIGGPLRRVLGLGAQGGGKSMGILATAVVLAVRRPNSLGGVVAPTQKRRRVIWKKFLEILVPAGLVEHVSLSEDEIRLVNGTLVKFVAAKRKDSQTGSPIAGYDWHWGVEDEQQDIDDSSLREVDMRGRINADYQVFSSATNEPRHDFQTRLQEYAANVQKTIHRFSGVENCFTPLAYWEELKGRMSPEDYDRYINCLDIPQKGRVYPQFSYQDSVAALPTSGDITAQLTLEKWQVAYDWIVGWDPGVVASASAIMKAFATRAEDLAGDRRWFVIDEVTTRDASTEWHARDLAEWFRIRQIPLERVLVIGDPHENKETDRSDYIAMRAGGFTAKPSNGGERIERKHRISMVNALLRDAKFQRRLFLAKGERGIAKAEDTARCFGSLMYTPTGEIDFKHKTYQNVAHWGDGVGYGLFPFERFRGSDAAKQRPENDERRRRPGHLRGIPGGR